MAKKLYKRALSGQERVLGLNDITTLNTVSNLAILLRKEGHLDESKKLLREGAVGF